MTVEIVFKDYAGASRHAQKLARQLNESVRVVPHGSLYAIARGKGKLTLPNAKTIRLAAVLGCLIAGTQLASSPENELVMAAIRRSSAALSGMSDSEIGEYLRAMNPEQLQGFANNVKGIYHELLVVNDINQSADQVATLSEATNEPGIDIIIQHPSGIIEPVQVKATNSIQYVDQHLAANPDISTIVTDEVASVMTGVISSGHSNEILTKGVGKTISNLTQTSESSIMSDAGSLVTDVIDFILGWL